VAGGLTGSVSSCGGGMFLYETSVASRGSSLAGGGVPGRLKE
jgi:hypothetical protein